MSQNIVKEEQSKRVSPDAHQIQSYDNILLSSPPKDIVDAIPNTTAQLKHMSTGTYNSPIGRSYSARRQKQQSHKLFQHTYSSRKTQSRSTYTKAYTALKQYSKGTKIDNAVISKGSGQSPTFRPKNLSSNQSNHARKAKKPRKCNIPPSVNKAKYNIIGKDSEGNNIILHNTVDNVSIDFIDDKPKNYQRKRISLEDEERTRDWLKRISFYEYIHKEKVDLMDDPLRNGVLYWELLWFVENIRLWSSNGHFDTLDVNAIDSEYNNNTKQLKGINYKPKTIKDCRDNLDKAISILYHVDRIRENIPPTLLANKELILKGDHATVWGILNYLRKLYPDSVPREKLIYLQNTLPYTTKELINLEASLLNWMYKWGVLSKYSKQPMSLLEIEHELKNGTLYWKLVEFIYGIKLAGSFAEPKTESAKINNIRKALDILKKEKSMSQKYTWSEREICKGNRECIIGLLEDLHILFDGYPPRKCGPHYFENGPHIGRVYDQIQRQPFYYHKDKDDTFELEVSDEEINQANKTIVKDYLEVAKQKYSRNRNNRDIKIGRNVKIKEAGTESESSGNFKNSTLRDIESGLNTERYLIKHENIPSIINNQIGSDICSPIAKISGKKHNFILSPENLNDYRSIKSPKELTMENFKSVDRPVTQIHKHNNQMSCLVSGRNSVDREKVIKKKHISEESINYTEKSRTEELEELEDHKQAAYMEYAESKRDFSSIQNNPFYIESKRPDIDPFREILDKHKSNIKASAEYDDLQQLYDEETMFMNRISNLKEFRKLIKDYINMGIKLSEDMSLDNDRLEDFKDGTLLWQIVGTMERSRISKVTKQPKSKASCLHNIK